MELAKWGLPAILETNLKKGGRMMAKKKEQHGIRLIDCLAQDQCQKKLRKKRPWWGMIYWKEEK